MQDALRLIRATCAAGVVYRTGQVAELAGTSRGDARAALLALAAEGSLRQLRPGYFRVVATGPLASGRWSVADGRRDFDADPEPDEATAS